MWLSYKNFFKEKYTDCVVKANVNHYWIKAFRKKEITSIQTPILEQSSSVMTMGSCFANELRNSLIQRGFEVFPRLPTNKYRLFSKFSHEIPAWGVWDERVHFQWYNPASLELEAKIAFSPKSVVVRRIFPCKKQGQNIFQDPHRRLVFADSESCLIELRESMDESIRFSFFNAQSFVFTLGLTETWWDKETNLPLCTDPDYGNPDSRPLSIFRNLDFNSAIAHVESLISLIRQHRSHSIPIFLSVSPIPLARTFRSIDIIVANTESKAILRTIASQISSKYENVFYFPSFEICQFDKNSFRKTDGRHVEKRKVESIINFFCKCYLRSILI